MPNVGDIKQAKEIGYKGRALFRYVACPDCGIKKWKPLHTKYSRCQTCAAKNREEKRNPVTYIGTGKPKIGDVTRANFINRKGRAVYVYATCQKCGLNRWKRQNDSNVLCPQCTAIGLHTMEKSGRWKGGIKKSRDYVYVTISPDNPYYSMSIDGNKIAEHRLVMAQHLGRCLTSNEVVHHINGIKTDNRLENLRLLTTNTHSNILALKEVWAKNTELEKRITLIEAENILVKSMLQEVLDSIPTKDLNLQCYNTLDSLLDKQIEGIVQSDSNIRNNNLNRCCCICRRLELRPLSEMILKNSANSVKPKSEGYGNTELADYESNRASVETLHGTSFNSKDEDKVRLLSKDKSVELTVSSQTLSLARIPEALSSRTCLGLS